MRDAVMPSFSERGSPKRAAVKTMLYIGSLDAYLGGLKSLVRKGRVHNVLIERTRLAGHLRENLKTLGLKRVSKEVPDLAQELSRTESREQKEKGEPRV